MTTQRIRVLLGVAILAAAQVPGPPTHARTMPDPVDLILESPHRSRSWSDLDGGIARARQVEVRTEVLDRSTTDNEQIRIELFEDTEIVVSPQRFTGRSDGSFIWVGTVAGVPGSRAILAGDGDRLDASLLVGNRSFAIRSSDDGHTVVEETRRPLPESHIVRTGWRYRTGAPTKGAGAIHIDAAIGYTPRAKDEAGGRHAVEALATLAIESMNETLRASGIDVVFRLVKLGQVEYWESRDVGNDLDDLAHTDSVWQLKSWRNSYGADVAMLLTGRDYGVAAELPGHYSVVGIGDDSGFSSINRVVELAVRGWGHNVGAGGAEDCGVYPDACAHHQPDGLFFTVMSDGRGCDDCLAAPVFSNPDVDFHWLDGGFVASDLFHGPFRLEPNDPSPLPTGVSGRADNAGAIAQFAPTAARWRDTEVRGPSCGGMPATWVGTGQDDRFFGTSARDVVVAKGGNDVIKGGGGPDVICGGPGDDRLIGGRGDDFLYGDGGADTLKGFAGDDVIDGGARSDELYGGAGDDVLRGGGRHDLVYGGRGQDSADGGPGRDRLLGHRGDDRLAGGPGRDDLDGGPGTDWLQPDPGDRYEAE